MNSLFNSTWRGITGCFLAGLFAVLPLIITVAILAWLADFIYGVVGPGTWVGRGLESIGLRFSDNALLAQAIGWLILLGGIFALGFFVQIRVRSVLVEMVDAVFHRLPVIGSVYGTASQFVGMLNKKDENQLAGMSVVYCNFGAAAGCGLLAMMPSGETYRFGERDYCAVYVPTSPVPMTGGLLFVPADSITRLEMSVDKLMSIYLSMGVTAPQVLGHGTGGEQ